MSDAGAACAGVGMSAAGVTNDNLPEDIGFYQDRLKDLRDSLQQQKARACGPRLLDSGTVSRFVPRPLICIDSGSLLLPKRKIKANNYLGIIQAQQLECRLWLARVLICHWQPAE